MSEPQRSLISVLVPVYNVQDYLEECLDSLLAQTFTNFEVICINDGSTDNSREIIDKYLHIDKRFRVIDKPNSGYGASMNRGLDAAQGKYLAILESDDFFTPDALERLLGLMEAHSVELVKANCFLYWSGPPKRKRHHDLVPHKQANQVVNPQVQHEVFHLAPSLWSALYRLDFLRENNIRFLETPGASYQDASFNFKVWVCASKVYFLGEEIIYYRQDNIGSSINSIGKAYCVCDEHAEMDRYIDEKGLRAPWLNAVLAKMRNRTYLWNYERLDEEFQFEFLLLYAREMQAMLDKGYLDWSLLDKWDRMELESILASPENYHKERLKSGRGNSGKIKRIFKIGGPVLLTRFLWSKLFR